MGTNTIKQSQTESDMTVESPWIPFENDIQEEEKNSESQNWKALKSLIMNDELMAYRQTLVKASKSKSSDIIVSNGLSYSLCLISVIIDSATSIVRILSFDEKQDYLSYEPICRSIISAKERGVDVKILTLANMVEDANLELYKDIVKRIPDNIYQEYKQVSPAFSAFVTGDDDMYRFDYAADSYNGLGSFNDPDMTGKFNTVFDNIYK